MTDKRRLPESASFASPVEGARLHAPSAERNANAIAAVLEQYAPRTGQALEIASGTGQHVVQFARTLPDLIWQPSDIDPERRESIDAWASESGLPNLRPAVALDAAQPGWGSTLHEQDLILLVNLLHLIREDEAKTVVTQAARALNPNGRLMLYGPFRRAGELTSEGDVRFNASLRAADTQIGYKDDFDVIDWLHGAGLALVDVIEMPANNLCLIAQRDG